jgi:hypothetical protein
MVSGCVTANPDDDTYKGKVEVTVGGALSEVATVQTILETLHEDRMFRPTAVAQMRYSQNSLDTNTGAFNEIHPPRDLDGLYARTNSLLSDATDAVNQADLAIKRNEVGSYPKIADDLSKLSDKLDTLEKSVS